MAANPYQRRNRAVTDLLEPGSTMKPIPIAAALSSGKFTPTTPIIDTTGGHWYFQGHDIHDTHNYGLLTPTGVITKSSNVGAAKIAMQLDTTLMYDTYRGFGFGNSTNSGFPGEAAGLLRIGRDWRPLEKAILGYGYGLNVTVLQLANAYATIADDGVMHTPSFIKGNGVDARQIISPQVAHEIVQMMETVTGPGSTAPQARIPNYSVAGKTGTAHKASAGGYSKNNYTAAFGRHRAGVQAAPGWRGGDRQPEQGQLLRRHGVRASVRQGDGRRAAPAGRAARQYRSLVCRRAAAKHGRPGRQRTTERSAN